MHDRILETALRLFCTFGTKSITMQDIARECGISKKTVYEHFADKTDLVNAVVAFMTSGQCAQMEQSKTEGRNAIEELVLSMRMTEKLAKTINPILLFELEKYHPSAWKTITGFKNEYVTNTIRNNLQRGIREGLFRGNIRINIVAHMRLMQLSSAFNPVDYPAAEFDLHEVLCQVTEHYIYGVATPEGQRLASEYLAAKETV